MEELRRLTDVIVDDQELVSTIINAFYQRLGDSKADDPNFKDVIEKSVDQVFQECEIYESLSRAVERFRAAPRLDVCATSSPNSIKKPGYSSAEPTKSSQLSRNKVGSPERGGPERSPMRGKGRISKGKYSPLAPSAQTVEQSEPVSKNADDTGRGEVDMAMGALKDGFSPPPDVQLTESPDIVEGGYGIGEKKLINASAAEKGEKAASQRKKEESPSPLSKVSTSPREIESFSPASSPEKTKKRHPFGSPGSGLEDENFEDSFDGGDINEGSGGLNFTKRYYRFEDGMPVEEEVEDVARKGLPEGALAAALGGLGGQVAGEDVTDDWLLSRSEGNPDENSLGDSFASSLNNSFSSVRSSHSGGGNRKSDPGSPGSPSPLRRLRQSGSKSRSPSPSSGSLGSPAKSPVVAKNAEKALRGMISGLGASPLSPAGVSPRARSRYGDANMRDSLESDPGKPSSISSPGADKNINMAQTFPPAGGRSPGDKKGKNGRGRTSSPSTTSASGSGSSSPISPAGGTKAPSPGLIPTASKGNSVIEGVAPASSLTEESSMDSGGPGNLDGGEEVYIYDPSSIDGASGGRINIKNVTMSMSFGKTMRTSGGLQAALQGDDDMADDFVDDFDEEIEEEEDDQYGEDDFASDREDEGWDKGALTPTASSSSPTRRTKKGKAGFGKRSAGVDLSASFDENAEEEEDGYGSDDFEMMDYEKDDKPNRKRVRFPRKSVVTDVYVTREKHGTEEKDELFYTHDETTRFTLDYSKETMKAEMVGLTWNDWWSERKEEDVQRDEEEEEARRASGENWYGDYYSYEDEEEGFEDDFEIEEMVEDDAPSVELDDSNEFSNF